MTDAVKCRRKTVKQCKRAYKSCEYARTAKSRHCRKCRTKTPKSRTLKATRRR